MNYGSSRSFPISRYHETAERCGMFPNIVVCNAGILYPTRILDVTPDEWDKTFAVNCHGVFNTMQVGLRHMVHDIIPNNGKNDSGNDRRGNDSNGSNSGTNVSGSGGGDGGSSSDAHSNHNSNLNSPFNPNLNSTLNSCPLPLRIVTISSSAGRSVSTLGGVHYTSSKAAVLGMTRAAAKEMGV
jgi:NAD(P)-dependent dehydrogenase (short-subunit alcohol dehydrogenase family)